MEGFVLVKLHENLINDCQNVDNMFLAHQAIDGINFYTTQGDKEHYLITHECLAKIVAHQVRGVFLNDKPVIAGLYNYSLKARIQSLIEIADTVQSHFIGQTDILRRFTLDLYSELDRLCQTDLFEKIEHSETKYILPSLKQLYFSLREDKSIVFTTPTHQWVLNV